MVVLSADPEDGQRNVVLSLAVLLLADLEAATRSPRVESRPSSGCVAGGGSSSPGASAVPTSASSGFKLAETPQPRNGFQDASIPVARQTMGRSPRAGRPVGAGESGSGRYWARTSDLLLVRTAQNCLFVQKISCKPEHFRTGVWAEAVLLFAGDLPSVCGTQCGTAEAAEPHSRLRWLERPDKERHFGDRSSSR